MSPERWGIPTTHDGVRFRSRLEARWAHFFTELHWRWEYEPFDLKGYIPDFAILGERPLLVEVKPALTWAECEETYRHIPTEALEDAPYDLLVVGATPLLFGSRIPEYHEPVATFVSAGFLSDYAPACEDQPAYRDGFGDGVAEWGLCETCRRIMIHHDQGLWTSRPCGHRNKHGQGGDPRLSDVLMQIWKRADNATKWRAP